jgi:3-methyl-2-oxobutanoate hydroxymethyltransferase
MPQTVSIPQLHDMKRRGEKIVGVVVWDTPMATIADRAGVEIVSVGDSVGVNLWGHDNPLAVTLDEMITVAKAARRGTERALVSCDFPYGPLQAGTDAALAAGLRLVKEAGVDMIKLDGAADFPESVTALAQAGIPIWAQFGITPQTAMTHGIPYRAQSEPGAEVPASLQDELVRQAEMLEAAGAALLDFTNSGPIVGPAVVDTVSIPVIGGFGGGPWLDGRVRMAHAALGYGTRFLEHEADAYAQFSKLAEQGLAELIGDVRAGRQIRGAPGAKQ